jgi:hypothetical protein
VELRVRKISLVASVALMALLPAACRTAAPGGGTAAGAPAPIDAVQRFVGAARASDARTMMALWGTSKGAVGADTDVEKRMIIFQCFLGHDAARVVSDVPGMGASRAVTVELRQGDLTRQTRFNAIEGPGRRWFVESFDINAVTDFCRPTPRSAS